jgi:ABC-2 type transport system ATP-binding protein
VARSSASSSRWPWIHDPDLVLLDELTTGLDPQARRTIWEMVRGIRDRGKTVLLTTHLMEEAERLCDRVAIIERGKVLDVGTPAGLVRRHCPEQTVVLTTTNPTAGEHFPSIDGVEHVEVRGAQFTMRGRDAELVTRVIQCVAEHRIRVTEFRTVLPNLEDVFLALTGHSIRD